MQNSCSFGLQLIWFAQDAHDLNQRVDLKISSTSVLNKFEVLFSLSMILKRKKAMRGFQGFDAILRKMHNRYIYLEILILWHVMNNPMNMNINSHITNKNFSLSLLYDSSFWKYLLIIRLDYFYILKSYFGVYYQKIISHLLENQLIYRL